MKKIVLLTAFILSLTSAGASFSSSQQPEMPFSKTETEAFDNTLPSERTFELMSNKQMSGGFLELPGDDESGEHGGANKTGVPIKDGCWLLCLFALVHAARRYSRF